MDNKKAVFIIILATILAFFAVFFYNKKTTNTYQLQEKTLIEESLEEIKQTEEKPSETNDSNINEENKNTANFTKQTELKSSKASFKIEDKEEPVFEQLKIEEPIVQEAKAEIEYIDPGIMIDPKTGDIIITRAFKTKSPTNYSFKGYGILDKVSTK